MPKHRRRKPNAPSGNDEDHAPPKRRFVRRLNAFLRDYKTIFEVGAATLLSVMAIIVSVAQSYWMQRQTDLLNLQTQILEAQALPQFKFSRRVSETADVITPESHVGVLRVARAEIYDLMVIETVRNGDHSVGLLPVAGYFDDEIAIEDFSPAVASLHSIYGRSTVFEQFSKTLERYTYRATTFYKREEVKFRVQGIASVIRVDYRDLLDRPQNEWFLSVRFRSTNGEVAVAPLRKEGVEEILDYWDQDDAVDVTKELTSSVVCEIAKLVHRNAV